METDDLVEEMVENPIPFPIEVDVAFICGCKVHVKGQPGTLHQRFVYDDQGYVVCAIHRLRRRGWHDLRVIGNEKGRFYDYSLACLSDLERQAVIVFGENPRVRVPLG